VEVILAGISALGGMSIGYSIMRIWLPNTQGIRIQKKIVISFIVGCGMCLPILYYGFPMGAIYSAGAYTILLFGGALKRYYLKEQEEVPLFEEKKKKRTLPDKAKAKEEKEEYTRQVNEKDYSKILKGLEKKSSVDKVAIEANNMRKAEQEKSKQQILQRIKEMAKDIYTDVKENK
jgi:flagellar biosynthesis component FlhA